MITKQRNIQAQTEHTKPQEEIKHSYWMLKFTIFAETAFAYDVKTIIQTFSGVNNTRRHIKEPYIGLARGKYSIPIFYLVADSNINRNQATQYANEIFRQIEGLRHINITFRTATPLPKEPREDMFQIFSVPDICKHIPMYAYKNSTVHYQKVENILDECINEIFVYKIDSDRIPAKRIRDELFVLKNGLNNFNVGLNSFCSWSYIKAIEIEHFTEKDSLLYVKVAHIDSIIDIKELDNIVMKVMNESFNIIISFKKSIA